jgi:hypothetical protein
VVNHVSPEFETALRAVRNVPDSQRAIVRADWPVLADSVALLLARGDGVARSNRWDNELARRLHAVRAAYADAPSKSLLREEAPEFVAAIRAIVDSPEGRTVGFMGVPKKYDVARLARRLF